MPPQVGVGVAAVIFRDNNLLMLQRSGAHGAGTWSVPGGWVEKGEYILQATEREVLEETGLIVRAVYSITWTETIHPEGVQDVCFWVLCEDKGGRPEIREPDKCTELKWVPSSAVRYQQPLFVELQAIFDQDKWSKIIQSTALRGRIS